jgi:hypothetical protein
LTTYNEKDKVTSVAKSELVSVNELSNGLEAVINEQILDEKGKELFGGTFTMRCEGDKFYMDMSDMFNQEGMEGIEDAEVEFTNQYMEYPTNPVVGQTLPDANCTMKITINGMQLSSTTINITNRKVEGNETITTPAGTFNCVKFSEDTEVKAMMMKIKSHSVSYMAKNVGMVKMESFDDKGKLESKQLLTAFSN